MTAAGRRSPGSLAREWDAVVVGAGPAGALAARQLALRGRRVLLAEKKRFPRPKVCGACISARAISALEAAGLEEMLEQLRGLPLQQLEILAEGRSVRVGLPEGVAVGRAEFDAALVETAVAAGVEFCDGTAAKVGPLVDAGRARELILAGETESAAVTARVVLAADGLQHACLSQHDAFASDVSSGSLIGLGATIPDREYALEPGMVRMVAGPTGYVGIVRIAGGRLNIAAAVEPTCLHHSITPAALIGDLLEQAGAAPQDLSDAVWHGTGALTRATRRVADDRLFLLGDATGYVEPFTGEGIAWALCSALLVAPLADGCLAGSATPQRLAHDWHALHEAEVRRRQAWCRRLAWVLRTPWRRRLALVAAATMPWLARRVARSMNQRFVLPQS